MLEDLLCGPNLTSYTTGADVLAALEECLVGQHIQNSKNCKGITSDVAANMTRKNSDVIKRYFDAADNSTVWNICFIHRQAMVSKVLSETHKEVLKSAAKTVNLIKGSSLNS